MKVERGIVVDGVFYASSVELSPRQQRAIVKQLDLLPPKTRRQQYREGIAKLHAIINAK
jgi:hypothetical protein